MKTMKKVLLLVTSLCFTGALAACGGGNKGNNDGGNGGGNISGETVANKAAWTQALTDSALATNATVSMTIKGEDRMGEFYEKGESSVTAKVANGKVYVYEKTDASWYFEEDGVVERDEEHDEDQTYLATIDGVTMEYFKELEQDWQISEWYQEDFSATLGFVLDWQADFSLTDVSEMYDQFVNNNGTYSCTLEMEEDTSTAQIKFVDGKVAWGKITMAGTYEGGATSTWEMSFTITYGNTTIGALPGQEEEPDSGNSSGGGSSASESGSDGKESDNVELPDTSVEIPETDGAPVANAEEWAAVFQNTLSATNATIITTASENGTLMEDGIVMIADGVTYEKWNNKDGSSSYCFYGEVNGQSYRWDSEDGKTWTYETTDWTPEDYATVAYELEGMDEMLLYADSKWDAATGMYVGENDYMTYSLKIADGKVVYISFYMESAMMPGVDVVYQIVYGQTAAMQLPSLDKDTPNIPEIPDVDGEQMKDAAEWNAAWQKTIAARNLTAVYTSTYTTEDGKTETEYGVGIIADGKQYAYDYDDTNGYAYMYLGEVDGKVYQWTSTDGENWDVEEEYLDIDLMTSGYMIVRGLNEMLDFSTAKYEKGYYVCTTDWATFRIKIADGYVVEIEMSDESEVMSYKMSFGGAEVGELPPLPQEEVIIGEEIKSTGDWADVLANTDEQTNFTYTANGRIYRDNGKTSIMTEYVAVDNGKVYVERESMVHSGNGSASGMVATYYQGIVGGVAYEWRDIGDDEWYVNQIDAIDNTGIVDLLGLGDLDFATAKFNSETGAYTFDADGAVISVRAIKGLILAAELITDTMEVEYRFVYGNASVELPPMDGSMGGGNDTPNIPEIPDVDGEQVKDAAEWSKIIANTNSKTNYVADAYARIVEGEITFVMDGYVVLDGNNCLQYMETMTNQGGMGQGSSQYGYMSKQGNQIYIWMSSDGKNWSPAEVYDGAYLGKATELADTDITALDFNKAKFDAEQGAYLFVSEDGIKVTIKVAGGLVVYIAEEGENLLQEFRYAYGNADAGEVPPMDGTMGDGGDVIVPELDWDETLGDDIIGEEVTEAEFANAIKKTYASTNFAVKGCANDDYGTGVGITYIADGKMYNYTESLRITQDGSKEKEQFAMYMGMVDGVEYAWVSSNGGPWESGSAEDIGLSGLTNGMVFQMYLSYADYNKAVFDAKTGAYLVDVVADDETVTVSIKIVDGYVGAFSLIYADMIQTFVIEYGTAYVGELPPVSGGGSTGGSGDVEIPEMDWDETLGDDIIGEEVDQAGFDEAIQNTYESQNMTSKQYVDMSNMEVVSAGYFADEKMYSVSTVSGQNGDGTTFTATQYTYAGWVDGVSYAWMSMDGRNWNTMKGEECGLVGYENGAYFSRYLAEFNYGSCTFDEKTGAYVLNTPDDSYQAIKITQGKVCAIIYVMKSEMTNSDGTTSQTTTVERCVIEYGTAYVGELPPVSGSGSTGGSGDSTEEPSNDEWDLAFENLLSGRNYSMKQIQDVAYYDGSKAMEYISAIKLTEYAIEEESELRTSDEEGDHIEIARNVWTNENGVDYEYTYNMETGIWEKAESSNTVEDIFQNIHSMFSIFAKMYDAMEWNANDGCFYAAEYALGANALYNVQIVIGNGNVQRISYDMRYDEYEGTMRIDLYDYECTEVTIPTEGQGDSGNGDNSGDVEIGGDVEIPVVGGRHEPNALYLLRQYRRQKLRLEL